MKLRHIIFTLAGALALQLSTPASAEDAHKNHDHSAQDAHKGHNHEAKSPEPLSEEGLALLEPRDIDVIQGDKDALVTIVEYASLSCPHCATFHNKIYPSIKEKWIDTGKVNFIYRNYPLNAPAFFGAKLTRCGGKDKFYDLVKVLMANQTKWALSGEVVEKLQQYASLAGISKEQFSECMGDKTMEENILSHMKEVKEKLKLRSTPTLYINGKMVSGAPTIEFLDSELEFALIAAKANAPAIADEAAPADTAPEAAAPTDDSTTDAAAHTDDKTIMEKSADLAGKAVEATKDAANTVVDAVKSVVSSDEADESNETEATADVEADIDATLDAETKEIEAPATAE